MRNMWMLGLLLAPMVATAQGRAMTVDDQARVRAVGGAVISPDGAEVAYVLSVPRKPGVDDDGPSRSELHVVGRNGTSRAFLAGKVDVGALQWLPSGDGITFTSKREGDKVRRLYRIPLRGGEAVPVVTLKSDISGYDLSPDGRRAALIALAPVSETVRKEREKGFSQKVYEEDWRPNQLWLQDLDDTAKATLVKVDGTVLDVEWSPAGDRLAVVAAPRQLTDDTMVDARVRIIGFDGRVHARIDNPGKLGQLAWSPDGAHLAIISAADANDPREGRLTVVGRDGGAQRDLLPGLEGHVWNVAWKDASTLLFVSQEGTKARLGEIRVDGSAQRTLLGKDGPVWNGLSASTRGDVALVASTAAHPQEVFRLGAGETQATRLTDSNPWLKELAFAKQETIRWTSRDGLELEGVLVHPLQRRGSARVPLVVAVHGGPEAHVSDAWVNSYAQPAQVLAARGFATFLPNYRASTGRGVAFSKLDHGKPGKEEFDDIVDGVEHLVSTGLVDRKKVGITGGSYGGYAAAWGATALSEHYAAAVMFVGISDQASLVTTGDIPREQYLVHMQTWPWESPEMYRDASPINHARKSRTPTLILHGEADPRVPVSQSYMMYRYLKLAGQAPVRLVLYPGEGHGNSRAASRYDYSLRLLQWMEHYLTGKGGEPPPYALDYRLPGADAKSE